MLALRLAVCIVRLWWSFPGILIVLAGGARPLLGSFASLSVFPLVFTPQRLTLELVPVAIYVLEPIKLVSTTVSWRTKHVNGVSTYSTACRGAGDSVVK